MTRRRSRLVPEVVQSSSMDCGPAALKSFLEGHGVPVSYGRLREACQTDVDGTSIETLEELGTALGVPLEQVLLPKDLVLLEEAEALPCIAVMRLPNGNTHFAVVWDVRAGVVQAMDPATGRRFTSTRRLLHDLYEHTMRVPAEDWRQWAASDEGLSLSRRRLAALRVDASTSQALIADALEDDGAGALAALDAALRTARALVDAGACRPGAEAAKLIARLVGEPFSIPASYWSARSEPGVGGSTDPTGGELSIRGAVLLRRARDAEAVPAPEPELSRALEAARDESPARPLRELWGELGRDGWLHPSMLALAFAASAGALTIEALLFRSLLELVPLLGLAEYRAGLLAALGGFMVATLLVDFAAVTGELRLGRRIEMRLRAAFQEKIPRLGDRYFRSRLISDMAERNHSLHLLRTAPRLGGLALRAGFELVLTTAAIIWLQPSTAPIALTVLAVSIAVPLLGQPFLQERDLRVRSHVGGLSRFYLDALLGLVPLRVHGAQSALRTEHEGLLTEWARSRLGLQKTAVAIEALQFVLGYGLIVALLVSYLRAGGEPAAILLLAYWALNLPVLGLLLVRIAWRYPEQRNTMLRVREPMRAPEERRAGDGTSESAPDAAGPACAIAIESVTVRAAGHVLLDDVSLAVDAGEHIAIVGASGSGKTSLLGLLLGWHAPDAGRVLVDGAELDEGAIEALRIRTAWVDPAVRLWNRSLIENLRYGNRGGDLETSSLSEALRAAELRTVLEGLPEGHQTSLGEGGGLVSGGEGQRVRLARALLRPHVSLALLDEPFRGLDRTQRSELLARTREHFREQTLLCVTHDVRETRPFDKVCVMESGRIVEIGEPARLAAQADSRYRSLLDAESKLDASWSDPSWRRWEIRAGAIHEPEAGP